MRIRRRGGGGGGEIDVRRCNSKNITTPPKPLFTTRFAHPHREKGRWLQVRIESDVVQPP